MLHYYFRSFFFCLRFCRGSHIIFENIRAIKYTPEGGSITIEAKQEGREFLVIVIDTGIGIAEEDLRRAFDKFFRAENAIEACSEGSGLGLSLSRQIALLHRGDIRISSEPGRGTEVTFAIQNDPARQKAEG